MKDDDDNKTGTTIYYTVDGVDWLTHTYPDGDKITMKEDATSKDRRLNPEKYKIVDSKMSYKFTFLDFRNFNKINDNK